MHQPKQEKKEMLSLQSLESGKVKLRLNYSSLNLISTCMKKADFLLNQSLKSETESSALVFGKAIHKGLEYWYSLPTEQREDPDAIANALAAYRDEGGEALVNIPIDDKRSLEQGYKLLKGYFKLYANDGWEAYRDSAGKPMVEKDFSFIMHDSPSLQIEYFGRIDVILHNKTTNITVVADHKTTSRLGTDFYNRLKPNHQYTGYIYGAKSLGIDTNMFMVTAMQTLKTKQEYARQITDRTEEDYEDLVTASIEAANRWINAKAIDKYSMHSPDACTLYSGCEYLDICQSPKKLQPNIIKAKYAENSLR